MTQVALLKVLPDHADLNYLPEGLALAKEACETTKHEDLGPLYALASALARSGRFAEAIEIAEKALKLAEKEGDASVAANVRDLMEFAKRSQHDRVEK
jgi:tetratricopeptide (TPR) repeat protein